MFQPQFPFKVQATLHPVNFLNSPYLTDVSSFSLFSILFSCIFCLTPQAAFRQLDTNARLIFPQQEYKIQIRQKLKILFPNRLNQYSLQLLLRLSQPSGAIINRFIYQDKTLKNMILTWGPDCDFIFAEWKATEWHQLWIGVAITFITCFLSAGYGPIIRKQIKLQSKTKLGLTLGYFFEYLLKLYVMLLMMTMNFYVNVAIAMGISLGYSVFSYYGDKMRRKIFRKSDDL